MTELTLGPNKIRIEEASQKDLHYWGERIEKQLRANPGSQFADMDRAKLRAIKAQIQRNQSPQAQTLQQREPAPHSTSTDLSLVEAISDPAKANQRLLEASRSFHLITPATSVGSLPEGCEVQFSMVSIPPEDSRLYRPDRGPELAFDRYHLIQFLNALGGSIDMCERIDDWSHPHYRMNRVVVSYRQFDGSIARRAGTADTDMRAPDGKNYKAIVEKAKADNKNPDAEIRQTRKFITERTESRALSRAISAMGVRRSYRPEELRKPFMLVKVAFTGRSDDPEARAQFRDHIAQSFLEGSRSLYGKEAPRRPSPPPQLEEDRPFQWNSEGATKRAKTG